MKSAKKSAPRQHSKAPYSFVSLAEGKSLELPLPEHSRFDRSRHSGYLELELMTETRLFVRAGVPPGYADEQPDANRDVWRPGSPYRECFHHRDQDRPILPGSSVRGMLRQLIEALSDSALTTAPARRIVYRAVADPTSFGWFYRRRFVGPNQEPGASSDSISLPQKIDYPVRLAHATDPRLGCAVHGGYLFKRGRDWLIEPAVSCPAGSDESFVHVDEAQLPKSLTPWQSHLGVHPVWVAPAARSPHARQKNAGKLTLIHSLTGSQVQPRVAGQSPPPGTVAATLVLTAGVGRKHMHCAIFEPDSSVPPLEIPPELVRLYRDDIESLRTAKLKGRALRPPDEAKHRSEERREPCFYMVDGSGELVFFGSTLFFRLPYLQAPADLAPDAQGDDFARRLFGGLIGGKPRKGRLRFEDLLWQKDDGEEGREREGGSPFTAAGSSSYVSPPPLLGPKPACIQHYLAQPESASGANGLRHYDDPYAAASARDDAGTRLRGFKHYWHRRGRDDPDEVARQASEGVDSVENKARKVRTVVRPVRRGERFTGRIYFDNLADEELGALLLAVDLKENLRHKLGMGRPLGFGSVKLRRTGLRLLSPEARYRSLFASDPGKIDSRAQAFEPGWRADSDVAGKEAKIAFVRAMGKLRGEGATQDDGEAWLAAFWQSPRMRELEAVLEWDRPPASKKTETVGIPNRQWKERFLLPSPLELQGGRRHDGRDEGRRGKPAKSAEPRIWRDAALYYERGGGGVLTASQGGQKAEVGHDDARRLVHSLSEAQQKRLARGRLRLDVEVAPIGRRWRLVSLLGSGEER